MNPRILDSLIKKETQDYEMRLRDHYAEIALQSLIATQLYTVKEVATMAYVYADEMMAARKKSENKN